MRRRGENISSFEVERMVNAHPDVVESAVVAADSELDEDEVLAVIVLKEESEVTNEQLLTFFAETMPYFMVPRYMRILDKTAENANPESTKSRTSATRCHPRYLGLYFSRPKSDQKWYKTAVAVVRIPIDTGFSSHGKRESYLDGQCFYRRRRFHHIWTTFEQNGGRPCCGGVAECYRRRERRS